MSQVTLSQLIPAGACYRPFRIRSQLSVTLLFLLPFMVLAADQLIVGPESDLLVDEIYTDSLGWRDSVESEYSWRKTKTQPEQKSRISWGYDPLYESLNSGRHDPYQRVPDDFDDTRPATLLKIEF